MWHSSSKRTSSMERNVSESEEKKCTEERETTSHVDSGFLSSGSLQISSELTTRELTEAAEVTEPKLTAPSSFLHSAEAMRVDSGVDLGLSESLSQLTLKQVTLNPLASGKIQPEPTTELAPVSDHRPLSDEYRRQQQQQLKQQNHQNHHHHHHNQRQHQHQYRHNHRQHEPDTNRPGEARPRLIEEPWQLYYTQDDDGDTQLHIAIVQGFVEAAICLIRMAFHPCLLNILNDEGQSPLHLAVLTRQPTIVRRLILAGANPSIRNFRGNTALHLACATGDLACAKALTDPLSLVERNYLLPSRKIPPALPQNLEQRNYDGEMCLHIAAAAGYVELVRLLLRLGADLEAREALAGKTALHLAVEKGCKSVVAFLLQECRPCLNTQTYAGITAYQIALCLDIQLARELVRFGATPEPLPESDSDSSDEEDDDGPVTAYMPTIARLRQNVVGVRV